MEKKLNKFYQLEAEANKKLGLTSTKGSGSKFDDADGAASFDSTNKILNECKYRSKGFISIPEKEWNKLQVQADRLQKIPVFTTIRETSNGTQFYTTIKTDQLSKLINKQPTEILEDFVITVINNIEKQFKNKLLISKNEIIELLKNIFRGK